MTKIDGIEFVLTKHMRNWRLGYAWGKYEQEATDGLIAIPSHPANGWVEEQE